MKFQKFFWILLLFVFLSNIASAEMIVEYIEDSQQTSFFSEPQTLTAEDIIISSIGTIDVFSCHNSPVDIYINNRFSNPVTIELSKTSIYYYLVDNIVTVNSGETKLIRAWVLVPCNIEGKYNNRLNIDVSYGNQILQKNLRQEIVVKRSNNLRVILTNNYSETNPGIPVRFTFNVENTGPFTETYTADLRKYSDQLRVLPNQFDLIPGQNREVVVTGLFNPEIYGIHSVPVRVKSVNNNLESNFDLLANISQMYDFYFIGPDSIEVCQDSEPMVVNYTVNNSAFVNNEYYFKLNAPRFASLYGTYLSLNPNQLGIVPLILNPESSTGLFGRDYVGNHSFSILTESKYGDLFALKEIEVMVLRCYSVLLSTNVNDTSVCSGDGPIKINVTNEGNFDENIILSLSTDVSKDLIQNIAISDSNISLSSGEFEEINLFLNQDELTELKVGKFKVEIQAYIESNPKIKDTLELKLNKETPSSCYELVVSPRRIYVETQENATEYRQTLELENIGIRAAEYELILVQDQELFSLNQTRFTIDPKNIAIAEMRIESNQTGKHIVFIDAYTQNTNFRNKITVYYERTNLWILLLSISIFILLLILLLLLFFIFKKKSRKEDKKVREQKIKSIDEIKPKKEVSPTKKKEVDKTKKGWRNFWYVLILLIFLILFLLLIFFGIRQLISPTDSVDQEINETRSDFNMSNIWDRFRNLFNFTRYENVTDEYVPSEEDPYYETLFQRISRIFRRDVTDEDAIVEPHPCPEVLDMLDFIEEQNLTGRFEYQVIRQNSKLKIDLSNYFIDPDGDVLNFSSEPADNITITHDGDIVSIIPDRGFCGLRQTVFYAEDPHGGVGGSPTVNLIILPKREIRDYVPIILLSIIILALIIAIVLLLILTKKN